MAFSERALQILTLSSSGLRFPCYKNDPLRRNRVEWQENFRSAPMGIGALPLLLLWVCAPGCGGCGSQPVTGSQAQAKARTGAAPAAQSPVDDGPDYSSPVRTAGAPRPLPAQRPARVAQSASDDGPDYSSRRATPLRRHCLRRLPSSPS